MLSVGQSMRERRALLHWTIRSRRREGHSCTPRYRNLARAAGRVDGPCVYGSGDSRLRDVGSRFAAAG
jgi:hypothetical protein